MVVTCKCPSCGAVMEFNGESGRLYCDSCKKEMSVEEYRAQAPREDGADAPWDGQEAAWTESSSEKDEEPLPGADDGQRLMQVQTYHCPSCGAELMTDEHTAVAVCTFCGNPGMIADRLSGERQPRAILPFRMGQEQAKEHFRKWVGRNRLAPRTLKSKNVIEKITGIYVPYWLYDYQVNVTLQASGTRVRKVRESDVEYTYTDYYEIYRDMDVEFEKIPVDASQRMDDEVMESLEPYDYSEMKPFDMAYLSGYQAEKFNYTSDELRERAEKRIRDVALEKARKTMEQSYDTFDMTEENVEARRKQASYVMLPVWVLNYRYKNKNYVFTLNGQTGKINGKLPMSAAGAVKWYGIVSGLIFMGMMAISMFKGLFG